MSKISFNMKDDGFEAIHRTGLFNAPTNNYYRVYGLKQEDNPPILIEYDKTRFKSEAFTSVQKFFKKNGVKVAIGGLSAEEGKGRVWIGIRLDARRNKDFTVASLLTMIQNLEGNLKLRAVKLKNKMPSFA